MWAKLDPELLDHGKVFVAGEKIGPNGPAIALGVYAVGLMWSNKHLTDGFIPNEVVRSLRHVANPRAVAAALTAAGLWEKNGRGYQIHDFLEFGNPPAARIKARRKKEKNRKAAARGTH